MIDPRSGAILPFAAALYPSAPENLLGHTKANWQLIIDSGPWRTHRIDNDGWAITATYHAGILRTVNLAVHMPGADGWREWDERIEDERNRLHQEELCRAFAVPPQLHHAFPWGTVSIVRDTQTGGSLILVEYHQ